MFRVLPLITAVLTLALSVLLLPPWIPAMPAAGLDPSWTAVLSHAFTHRWEFGTEIVFTYGPYGFVSTALFDPDNYALMMAFWIVLAATLAAAVLALLRGRRFIESIAVVALVFVGLRSGQIGHGIFNSQLFNDPVFFLVPLLALLLACQADSRAGRWVIPPLIALAALAGLAKFTFALAAVPMIALIDLSRWSRRRWVPTYLLSYLVLTALFFWLAGQPLRNLPAYAATALTVAAGYSEGEQLPGDAVEIIRFLGCATCLMMLAALAEWREGSWRKGDIRGAAVLAGLVLFIFMVFKAGFVRHDVHSVIAWSSLTAGGAAYLARYLDLVPGAGWRAGMLALSAYVGFLAVSIHTQRTTEAWPAFLDVNFGRGLAARVSAAVNMTAGAGVSPLIDERARALAAIRARYPLPPIRGTIDIYPWNAAVPLAHGFDYAPRPVYQSYLAFTGRLLDLNRRHLESEEAASTLLFDVETIDNQFPALEEGSVWPTIISRYDPDGMTSAGLLLRRRSRPRAVDLRALRDVRAGWNATIPVPADAALVWTRIAVDRTALGVLWNVFFKLPPLYMLMTTEHGGPRIYRIPPGMTREGFLLSPIVDSAGAFDRLLREGTQFRPPTGRTISVTVLGPDGVASLYGASIAVQYQALAFDTAMAPPPEGVR